MVVKYTDLFVSDALVCVFTCSSLLFAVATAASIYSTVLYRGPARLRVFYYLNTLITIIPFFMNTIRLLDINMTYIGNLLTDTFLNGYYIEWLLTTPLMLIQFALFVQLSVHHTSALIVSDVFMILCGYASYVTSDPVTKMALFSAGSLAFMYIAGFVVNILRNVIRGQHLIQCDAIIVGDAVIRRFGYISYSLLGLWIVYPCVHLLQCLKYMGIHWVVISYTVMDVLAKGISFNSVAMWIRCVKNEHLV